MHGVCVEEVSPLEDLHVWLQRFDWYRLVYDVRTLLFKVARVVVCG